MGIYTYSPREGTETLQLLLLSLIILPIYTYSPREGTETENLQFVPKNFDRYKPIYLERGRKPASRGYGLKMVTIDINLCSSRGDGNLP